MDKKHSLQSALEQETIKFRYAYEWLDQHLSPTFFQELEEATVLSLVRAFIELEQQDFFSIINCKNYAIVLCLNKPDADVQILSTFANRGIESYRIFLSDAPLPIKNNHIPLKVGVIHFTHFPSQNSETTQRGDLDVFKQLHIQHPTLTTAEYQQLLANMPSQFIRSFTEERLILAIEVLRRAQACDSCQYEVKKIEDWQQKKEAPSLQIILGWRHAPKKNFLYEMAKIIHRHGLALKKASAAYTNPYSKDSVLLMSLGLHGQNGEAAWKKADLADFLQELISFRDFQDNDLIEKTFVETKRIRGNLGHFLKTLISFVHQFLVHVDPNLYSLQNIEEGLCRHPELTVMLTEAFEAKFHPKQASLNQYESIKQRFLGLVDRIDTGSTMNDNRRKNILKQGLSFIEFCLKTNFYAKDRSGLCYRMDPRYLDNGPINREEKFPELPYAIFMMQGSRYLGFHIRFRDLARGGVRTVYPARLELMNSDRNNLFLECYNLAYTQQKKNKDIPEGGAKGVILLEPYETLIPESDLYQHEMEIAGISAVEIDKRLNEFQQLHKWEALYQAQRSYITNFLTIINCTEEGKVLAADIVDYYQKPEYIYLGPDENMHDSMIEWICNYAQKVGYKPGRSFMTGKPGAGINHKEFGVTSYGVNVYMEEALKFLDIDPKTDRFTVKMTGGPDGDVAGNQINNLFAFYPNTAKLLTTVDISGVIFDPQGLDLTILVELFRLGKPLRFYPPEKLKEGGFLLDLSRKREESSYTQHTLLVRKKNKQLVESWIAGDEMNHIYRTTVHQTVADVFIPGGGRPRTLNETNLAEFLTTDGKPTAKAIIEGANLYLTPGARKALEKMDVIVLKDSSTNKGGVICSSFEVLAGLILSEKQFLEIKDIYVKEIVEIIGKLAREEARLLLKMRDGNFLTDLSDWISSRINHYIDELFTYLAPIRLHSDPNDPLIHCLLQYCPPILRSRFCQDILEKVPDMHKKAIISCFLAGRIIYRRGLEWAPSIVDVLPLIIQDDQIISDLL